MSRHFAANAAPSAVPSRCPYSFIAQPQPAELLMTRSAPANAATLARASSRAGSGSPACTSSAPQQRCAAGTSTSKPLASSSCSVARFTRPNIGSMMQPVNSATRTPRRAMPGGGVCSPVGSGRRSWAAGTGGAIAITCSGINRSLPASHFRPRRSAARSSQNNVRSLPWRATTWRSRKRASRGAGARAGRWRSSSARVVSRISP